MKNNPNSDKHILVVDDDHDTGTTLKLMLENAGYRVCVAHDGRAARELFSRNTFDAVVADFVMPLMNGLDLLKWVKANKPIPFFLITGFTNLLPEEKAQDSGADGYLVKPFDKHRIVSLIKSHCR